MPTPSGDLQVVADAAPSPTAISRAHTMSQCPPEEMRQRVNEPPSRPMPVSQRAALLHSLTTLLRSANQAGDVVTDAKYAEYIDAVRALLRSDDDTSHGLPVDGPWNDLLYHTHLILLRQRRPSALVHTHTVVDEGPFESRWGYLYFLAAMLASDTSEGQMDADGFGNGIMVSNGMDAQVALATQLSGGETAGLVDSHAMPGIRPETALTSPTREGGDDDENKESRLLQVGALDSPATPSAVDHPHLDELGAAGHSLSRLDFQTEQQSNNGSAPQGRLPNVDASDPLRPASPIPKHGDTDASSDLCRPHASSSPLPPSRSQIESNDLPGSLRFLPRTLGRYTPTLLAPGNEFVGHQKSDRQVYNVHVEIKHVDMAQSFLCGYLRIEGLTADHPTLTTYFEGEVIGSKYSFTTRHPDWGSTERQDMLHWNKFAAWKPLAKAARAPGFSFKNFTEREHIFMRWKEYFLVPDHKVRSISGASFEGFYYICFNQRKGTFDGIYYHSKSERFQHLTLRHKGRAMGCMAAIEMR